MSEPLVGRTKELARINALIEPAAGGHGHTVFLSGEGGIGKTKMVSAIAERASRREWTTAIGRAYPVESGIPYALFADALRPLLSHIDPAQLTLLTRGASMEMAAVLPWLSVAPERELTSTGTRMGADPSEIKARLLWNFAKFLTGLSSKRPLLIALDNLQWADVSSLELLHFLARQIPTAGKIALVGTYNEAERDLNPMLRTTEQSLLKLGVATIQRLDPLSEADVVQLLIQTFEADAAALGRFPSLLYAWTRGNPFFIHETLKFLLETGVLRERDGRWLGWELETLHLPPTVREAITARVDRLSSAGRSLANLAAVIGTRVTYDTLRAVSDLADSSLVAAIDELRAARVLEERTAGDVVAYDFTHPLLREVLYDALGQAHAGLLHAAVAETLENKYGETAFDHADELAFHFARAHARVLRPKTATYLTAAGRNALQKYANREAAEYLTAALAHLEQAPSSDGGERLEVLSMLARARQRLGEYDRALSLWARALEATHAAGGAAADIADIRHRMGLACYWSGRYDDALDHYSSALAELDGAAEEPVAVRLHLARGICLQDLGKLDAAAEEISSALTVADRIGNPALLARVHRAFLLLYAWRGPPSLAREHGRRAIALAEKSRQQMLLWSGHWGMALLAGLTGDAASLREHLAESERIAEDLGSPLLPLWTAELAIQYAAGVGDWETGIATGERVVALARTLGQRMLLPRLLVWTGLIYLERGDPVRAKEMFDEAWQLSGAARGADRPVDIPSVVPAHLGLAAFHLTMGNYSEACAVGEAGLLLADRAGHRVWVVQWLLPLVAEARLRTQDFATASAHGLRLRTEAEQLDHRLGLAFARTCEGLLLFYRDKSLDEAAAVLRQAAAELEEIPYPYNAARIRREVARALRLAGDRDGAIHELRVAHDVFARLGATGELTHTREDMRTLGVRPPLKTTGSGTAGLSARELEIARMVAQHKANKEIGAALKISARTVSTHLSNIFAKLGVDSRGALADYVREKGLLEV